MTSRISERKKIREMDALELTSYAKSLWVTIRDKNKHEENAEPDLTLFAEIKAQYRQLTGDRLRMSKIIS